MPSEVLHRAAAAVETAYLVSGVIPGEPTTPAFEAAVTKALKLLPDGQVRWTDDEGKLTNGARHVLEETFVSIRHLLDT